MNCGTEEYIASNTSKGWATVKVNNLNKYRFIRIYATSLKTKNYRFGMNQIPLNNFLEGGSVQFRGILNINTMIDAECTYVNDALSIYSDGETQTAVYGVY